MTHERWKKDIDKQKWINEDTGEESYKEPAYCGNCHNRMSSCTCNIDESRYEYEDDNPAPRFPKCGY